MKYEGSCHCGDVKFEVEAEPGKALECNCSMCRRSGHLLWFVSPDKFVLKTPESALATYTFNRHVVRHQFCRRCGVKTFGRGEVPRPTVAVNVRCLEGVDPWSIEIQRFDGAKL